jgi:hypothetical protein
VLEWVLRVMLGAVAAWVAAAAGVTLAGRNAVTGPLTLAHRSRAAGIGMVIVVVLLAAALLV